MKNFICIYFILRRTQKCFLWHHIYYFPEEHIGRKVVRHQRKKTMIKIKPCLQQSLCICYVSGFGIWAPNINPLTLIQSHSCLTDMVSPPLYACNPHCDFLPVSWTRLCWFWSPGLCKCWFFCWGFSSSLPLLLWLIESYFAWVSPRTSISQ